MNFYADSLLLKDALAPHREDSVGRPREHASRAELKAIIEARRLKSRL